MWDCGIICNIYLRILEEEIHSKGVNIIAQAGPLGKIDKNNIAHVDIDELSGKISELISSETWLHSKRNLECSEFREGRVLVESYLSASLLKDG